MCESVQHEFGNAFFGRRVLITGHTGFKGGWVSTWLVRLGAEVVGVALHPEPGPSFFEATGLDGLVDSRIADIRDPVALAKAAGGFDAELVIHMAAQPLVRRSYRQPAETFATNVGGTAHVLDLARRMPSLRAVVVVTSDKCYEDRESNWGYSENDPMGGADPYSASKGCTELLCHAYRQSFFSDPDGPQLATVRAGNVFGGGDWGEDRLVPDIVRAAAAAQPVHVRNPESVRPWQHVLEPLSGYLLVSAQLMSRGAAYAGAWNFGPDVAETVTVRALANMVCEAWGPGGPDLAFADHGVAPTDGLREVGILRLDCTKARTQLAWRPQLDQRKAIGMTVDWYRRHAAGEDMIAVTRSQFEEYSKLMMADGPLDQAPIAAQ